VRLADTHPESIILLGAEAHAPEIEYGWIEPGRMIVDAAPTQIHRVSRFWEKPSKAQARRLLRAGCLWNTFVAIGRAGAFMDLLTSQIPEVVHRISDSPNEGNLDTAYEEARAVDFSREILAPRADRLLVLRDAASGWPDLGNLSRVVDTLVRNRIERDWLNEMAALQASLHLTC